MKIKEYLKPRSMREAYELYSKGAVILGGGAFLNLGEKEIERAIDISALGLDYIKEDDQQIEIGAMTTLREIEISPVVNKSFSGVLSKAAASIMGVQVRNIATIGGSIYGKYGFSDLLTVLLALDAQIELYISGSMSLQSFLEREIEKDIIMRISIKKNVSKAAFACTRKTDTDFSMVNAAAAIVDGHLRLSVGARPGRAKLVKGAMSFFRPAAYGIEAAETLAVLTAEELEFGSDVRASDEYRKELCKTLIKRCAMEVL